MVLIVEDGTMPIGANTYATVWAADTYFANIGDADWAALTTVDKEYALIRGAVFINNQQVYPYNGNQQTLTQSMPYPRTGAAYWNSAPQIPDSFIPSDLIKANIVAAGLSAQGQLPEPSAGGQETKREKVDVIEVEYFHSTQGQPQTAGGVIGASVVSTQGHPEVTGILLPLLREDVLGNTEGTGVTRQQAARRAGWYRPASVPNSFNRGQFDKTPLSEDAAMRDRTAATRPVDPTVP
jgi:hypothetical protein